MVDDNEGVREVTLRSLRELGFQPRGVSSALEALDALKRDGRVDLLLSDVVLPGGMSGPELAEEILRARPGLPILLMSGFPGSARERLAGLPKPLPILEKPFTRSVLLREIRSRLPVD